MNFCSPTRRRFSFALIFAGLPEVLKANEVDAQAGADKRQFMKRAIEDIQNLIDAAEKVRAATVEKTGAAPLFVQIPTVIPFVDWDYYYIDRQLIWAPPEGSKLPVVRVPRGFVTDLASVPSVLWSKYPPTGRYAYAAIVHDYLYWYQEATREVADKILAVAMADAKTDEATIKEFYSGLRLIGWHAWSANEKARKAGEKRTLKQFPSDRLISWSEWRKRPNVFSKR